MGTKVTVVEKNQGRKIPWEQNGAKLTFGDDELTVNVARYQRDWPVNLDVCGDKSGNLVIGVGEGRFYAAQVAIPAIQYVVPEPVEAETEETDTENTGDGMGEGAMRETAPPVPVPLEMSDVVLTLWAVDGLRD